MTAPLAFDTNGVQSVTFSQGDATWTKYRERALTDLYWFADVVLGYGTRVPMREYAHRALCRIVEGRTGCAAVSVLQAVRRHEQPVTPDRPYPAPESDPAVPQGLRRRQQKKSETKTVNEDRTQFLGGSEVGAILGVDPFKTRLQLYEEKVGIAQPFEGNRHTRRGNWYEAAAAELYMEQTGRKVQRMNQRIVHPKYPFITCRVDRRIVGEKRILEIKCPSLGSFAKIKREGLHEGYIGQLHEMLGLTVSEGGDWGIFSADQFEEVIFPVDFDAKLYDEIILRMIDFWESYVLKRVPPPAEYADEERIELQRAEGSSKLYKLTDPAEVEALVNLRDAKRIKADAETLEEDAKAHVQQIVGENFGIYTGGGVKLNYYQSKGRSSFDKKALAGAKPLDRIKVGVALTPLFAVPAGEVAIIDIGKRIEAAIAEVGKADLDLTQFEKQGAPYGNLRVTEDK